MSYLVDQGFMGSLSLFLLAVGLWVCYAYCWQKIAERTGTGRAWWAWVPILNVFLVLRIAKRPLWWFILFAIPLVNVYVTIRILVDICRVVGESPWLAVPLLIPGVNLPLFAYLAGFTKTTMLKAITAAALLVLVFPSLPILLGMAVWNSRSIQLGALKHPDSSVRAHAARHLRRICPASHECEPALLEAALHDPDGQVRMRAAEALGEICPRSQECVLALIEALDDPIVTVQMSAAYALGAIGPEAEEAVPALVGVVSKEYEKIWEGSSSRSSEHLALVAIQALGGIGPPARGAIPVLMAIRTSSRTLCVPADNALGRIGVSTRDLRPCW